MNIGARLEAVAALVPQGSAVADIGTDHAYLPVWLVRRGVIAKAVAGDIAEGPCAAARANVRLYGLKDKIAVRRGSGLEVVQPGEVNVAVMAGMGAATIISILQDSPQVAQALQYVVAQPMAGAGTLRRWAAANGWRIAAEALAEEAPHLYEIMLLEHGTEEKHSEIEYEVGPRLIEGRHPLLTKQLAKLENNYRRLLANMQQSPQAAQSGKFKTTQALLAGLEELKHVCNCK